MNRPFTAMCLTRRQLVAGTPFALAHTSVRDERDPAPAMIDIFALLLVHGLLFVALFRLMLDDTLDIDPDVAGDEPPATPVPRGKVRKP